VKLFTIFDNKAECYSQPFYALTDQAGVRTFVDAVNQADSPYNRHPEDYSLFSVGSYDDRTGVVTPHPHQHLGHAANMLRDEPTPLFAEGKS